MKTPINDRKAKPEFTALLFLWAEVLFYVTSQKKAGTSAHFAEVPAVIFLYFRQYHNSHDICKESKSAAEQ